LFNEVPVTCDASFTCYDSIYQLSYQGKISALSSITLEGRSNNVKLASVELPPDIYDRVGSISLEGLTFSLPADPVSYLADRNGNLFFEFNYKHTCGVAAGAKFIPTRTDTTGSTSAASVRKTGGGFLQDPVSPLTWALY
ncbi:MAG: hypothetical protein J6X82_06560, partial [Bacteroidales bacterium]|nr:hypothetical protein [Bacteroidales bacterium]